jgi:hypothetical protein
VQKPFEFDELFTLLSSHPAHTESDSG